MRGALVLMTFLAGCNAAAGQLGAGLAVSEVQPGLASCLVAIDRPDVAAVPDAAMSRDEIAELVDCTAERAGG